MLIELDPLPQTTDREIVAFFHLSNLILWETLWETLWESLMVSYDISFAFTKHEIGKLARFHSASW